ncbi:CLUMA_CG008115, isoform A [Clunio marinus]|uniref:CLUMA_CG008115, isoform A n=1 Tax=Clunio marinus TaxID=568069 RepID=A0A1J1I2N8_9DIPT|nr:CLUMA_CG008115, isoform A [Clunio marinus]
MKSIQEYTILWNATESGTFIIQVMRQRERNNRALPTLMMMMMMGLTGRSKNTFKVILSCVNE